MVGSPDVTEGLGSDFLQVAPPMERKARNDHDHYQRRA
jgi:hypothetical protein